MLTKEHAKEKNLLEKEINKPENKWDGVLLKPPTEEKKSAEQKGVKSDGYTK